MVRVIVGETVDHFSKVAIIRAIAVTVPLLSFLPQKQSGMMKPSYDGSAVFHVYIQSFGNPCLFPPCVWSPAQQEQGLQLRDGIDTMQNKLLNVGRDYRIHRSRIIARQTARESRHCRRESAWAQPKPLVFMCRWRHLRRTSTAQRWSFPFPFSPWPCWIIP